ncbi:MAG: ethanolamine ammonia-lyase reactivating factor EutA, partial [Bacteroidetes bacterium]|nr:ethanolamine ammonia-lyase reactivating factor EutA [Bacteroidota bacterium]
MKVLSAIDIGSNAARLLVAEVLEYNGETHYKKRSLVRSPLRLGEEVFKTGAIPPDKARQLLLTMQAYKNLMEVHGSADFMACATSAMRDAKNGPELVQEIRDRTGIKLNIIAGATEAKILYATHFEKYIENHKAYIYIDVGGGSTEVTIFKRGDVINTRSFNIGTLRLKNNQVKQEQWREMQSWVEIHAQDSSDMEAIGSGGNINKL